MLILAFETHRAIIPAPSRLTVFKIVQCIIGPLRDPFVFIAQAAVVAVTACEIPDLALVLELRQSPLEVFKIRLCRQTYPAAC